MLCCETLFRHRWLRSEFVTWFGYQMVEALVLNLFVPLIVLGCGSSLLLRMEVLLHHGHVGAWVRRASSLNLRKCYLSLLDRPIRLRLHFWKLSVVR